VQLQQLEAHRVRRSCRNQSHLAGVGEAAGGAGDFMNLSQTDQRMCACLPGMRYNLCSECGGGSSLGTKRGSPSIVCRHGKLTFSRNAALLTLTQAVGESPAAEVESPVFGRVRRRLFICLLKRLALVFNQVNEQHPMFDRER
jgi:hypothetical protein